MIGLRSTRTICTVLTFVKNVFGCDLWDRVRVKMHNRIVCNCVASAHCEWACALSDYQLGQRTLRILNSCVLSPYYGCLLKISGIAFGHKRMFFLCCRLTCESLNGLLDQKTSGTCASCLHLERANDFAILLWFDVDWRHSAPRCSPNWMIWTLPSLLHRSLKTLTFLMESCHFYLFKIYPVNWCEPHCCRCNLFDPSSKIWYKRESVKDIKGESIEHFRDQICG